MSQGQTTNAPPISVLMCVHNGAQHLREAIESILNQSFSHFQFVIVDDASTDNTKEIITEFKEKDARIQLLCNKENIGHALSLNEGIRACTGKYVARMDADDISVPNRLERQYTYLEQHEDISILGTGVEMFQVTQNETRTRLVQHPTEVGEIHFAMFTNCCVVHPSVMMRRNIFDEFNYETTFPHAEDIALWLRTISTSPYRIANLPMDAPLLRLRKHAANVSKTQAQTQRDSMRSASQHYLRALVGREISKDVVSGLVDTQSSVKLEAQVVELVESLEKALCAKTHFTAAEKEQIQSEATKRIGELTTLAMSRDPGSNYQLFTKWVQKRNPKQQLFSLLASVGGVTNVKSTSTSTSEAPLKLSIICFSKDRAFQLQETLRSISLFLSPHIDCNISVLYKATVYTEPLPNPPTNPPTDPPTNPSSNTINFQDSYDKVKARFPHVKFVTETNFGAQVKELVDQADAYVMYCVDDVFFYNDAHVKEGLRLMQEDSSIFGYYLKLYPGLDFCHTANASMRQPQQFTTTKSPDVLKWEMNNKYVSHDWNYPFDMCATIYRKSDMSKLIVCLENMFGKTSYSHPNTFEANGNRPQILNCFSNSTFAICPSKPVLSVLTVNRVQDIYKNPIYKDEESGELTVGELDKFLWEEKEIDISHYQTHKFNSVHIGDFVLRNK